jgi:type IV pilus assembly protein PilY1
MQRIPHRRGRLASTLFGTLCAMSAAAAPIDLATTPIGTATSGTVVKPNVMFILDASGSMNADYVPDPVNPIGELGADSQHSFNCRTDSNDTNACQRGDPPYHADRFNGLAYNPQFTYRAGVNADGSSRGDQRNWQRVPVDNYDATVRFNGSNQVDITSAIPEIGYCAVDNCDNPRRNGIHNGTTFAYAAPPRAAFPNPISFTRSGHVVTSAVNPGVQVGDVIDVVSAANPANCINRAVRVASATQAGFTYEYGEGDTPVCTPGRVSFSVVGYPEPANGLRDTIQTAQLLKPVPTRAAVTVTFQNHGLIPGDVIEVTGGANCTTGAAGALVGTVTANTFTYNAVTANGQCGAAVYTIKRRPANIRKAMNGAPFYFTLSPTEYCSDLHLTTCIAATAPTGNFTFPAYVRYCSSDAFATQAPPVTVNAGQPACIDKYSAKTFPCGNAQCGPYVYPRYGLFTRGDIAPGGSYAGRPARTDCVNAPVCNGAEEMTNYANWFSYYRRRIQAMKSAAGLAFQNVDERYRVGFILIKPSAPVVSASLGNCASGSGEFVPVDSFSATQKQLFYCTLYSQQPNGGTPLRSALARVGRYYAHKTDGINAGMSVDPVQYSCQQNYALLTTDGYWKSTGGAPALDGNSPVGNQDNNLNDPQKLVSIAAGTYDGGCPDGLVDTIGGCANTLADVAMYYYRTDLRDNSLGNATGALGTDVSANNVPQNADDPATWQHMVTFTVGLADGLMTWQKDYQTAATGDFKAITSQASGCFWSGSGKCQWPVPAADTPSALDDLWHAAVNAHGSYFHASDPQSLAEGLSTSLARVNVVNGAASGATPSTPNFTSTDNFIFGTGYVTGDWTGTLHASTVTLDDKGNLVIAEQWRAEDALDGRSPAGRIINTFSDQTQGRLKPFTYDNLTATEKQWLDNVCVPPARLSQCANLTAADRATLNRGQTIVDFIRGSAAGAGKLVRARKHVLGDIANSSPAFVRVPLFQFADAVRPSYSDFKAQNANRRGMVYVGANDGMLHAFDATTGAEVWAYVPRMLIRKLPLLADVNYSRNHTFFVDGTPAVMDAYFGGSWHTVLVAGLNAGGRGYFALDVTNPSAPQALWEFCSDVCAAADADLGYTYGNPIITKRNGEWVALLASGYNNVNPGTGRELLYVVRLSSGEIIERLFTGTGTADTPSSLSKISAFADDFIRDNTTQFVYGGDLAGQLWRFDLTTSPGGVLAMANLTDATGRPQPITTRPEIGVIRNSRVVFVGTGRLLSLTDVPDPATLTPRSNAAYQQSLYAIKDTGAPQGNVRASLVPQTITTPSADTRSSTNNPVDWTAKSGWVVDFNPANTSPGERVTLDPVLTVGTLTVFTNVPNPDACTVGGQSWVYSFDYQTGSYVSTSPGHLLAQRMKDSVTVGFVIVNVPNAGLKAVATNAFRRNPTFDVPIAGSLARGRRIGWREITR